MFAPGSWIPQCHDYRVCERDDDDDDDDEIAYFSVRWKPESETTKVRLKTSFSLRLPHQNEELQV